MPSANKTETIQLSQYQGNEYQKRTDVNDDNLKIDNKFKEIDTTFSQMKQQQKTYAQLATMVANNQLVAGTQYVLTNYATKYQQPSTLVMKTMSVERLVLTATSTNTFDVVCSSLDYPQDVIYYQFGLNICEDGTTPRTGFITRRIDESANVNIDATLDWRKMMWARYLPNSTQYLVGSTLTNYSVWTSGNAIMGVVYKSGNMLLMAYNTNIPTSATDGSVFSVVYTDITVGMITGDLRVGSNGTNNIYLQKSASYIEYPTFGAGCNRITMAEETFGTYSSVYYLGNHVFGANCSSITFGVSCHTITFGANCGNISFNGCCYGNVFMANCSNITFGTNCANNLFMSGCVYINFGTSCTSNVFSVNCSTITFGANCSSNIFAQSVGGIAFGGGCGTNVFGFGTNTVFFAEGCSGNIFGLDCSRSTFGSCCSNNHFGNYSYENSLGSYSHDNTFGLNCYANSFAVDCSSNTFGDSCCGNTFGSSCANNKFSAGCSSNYFGSNSYGNVFLAGCTCNTFGATCYANSFGTACNYNKFGSNCANNIFATNCGGNAFATNCYNNSFGANCGSNTFGAGCVQNVFGANCGNNTLFSYIISNTMGDGKSNITFRYLRNKNISAIAGLTNGDCTITIDKNGANGLIQYWYINASNVVVYTTIA